MASKQTAVTTAIKSIEFDNMGQLVIVTQPNKYNERGSYVMNAAQEARLLKRVGLSNVVTLKHLIKVANGTAKLSFIASENKTGDVWDNGKTGTARKSGTYTKDWIGFSNHEIDLGFIANTMVAEMALKAEFAAAPMRMSAPAMVANTTNNTEASNIDATVADVDNQSVDNTEEGENTNV